MKYKKAITGKNFTLKLKLLVNYHIITIKKNKNHNLLQLHCIKKFKLL